MLNIRFANENDYDGGLKIVKQVHDQHVEYRPDFFKAIDIPMSKDEFLATIKNDNIIVGIKDNEIIGYIYFFVKENRASILVDRKFIFIDTIGILEDKQSKGYGKEFIKYLKEYAKNNSCEGIELNVNIKNEKALKFYLNSGFEEREKKMEIKI